MWICWILYCLYINYTCVSVSHILHITRNYVIITCGTILKTPVSTSFTLKLHLASPSDKELISYPCFQIQKTLYWRDNFRVKKKRKSFPKFQLPPKHCFFATIRNCSCCWRYTFERQEVLGVFNKRKLYLMDARSVKTEADRHFFSLFFF